MACGKDMRIKYIDQKAQMQKKVQENTIENFAKDLDLPINFIDD